MADKSLTVKTGKNSCSISVLIRVKIKDADHLAELKRLATIEQPTFTGQKSNYFYIGLNIDGNYKETKEVV